MYTYSVEESTNKKADKVTAIDGVNAAIIDIKEPLGVHVRVLTTPYSVLISISSAGRSFIYSLVTASSYQDLHFVNDVTRVSSRSLRNPKSEPDIFIQRHHFEEILRILSLVIDALIYPCSFNLEPALPCD